MTTKPKAAIYTRISKGDREINQISIQEQNDAIRLLAEKHGYEIDETLVFSDTGSAKKPGRPGFEQMMKAIETGKVEAIITFKLNRLARNPVDGGYITWKLQQGIIKRLITEDDTYAPDSDLLLLYMHFGMSNQFSLNLNRRERGLCPECEHNCYKNPEQGVWL
jgi:DNA invertase Pin-like site-specific DNA recombinase